MASGLADLPGRLERFLTHGIWQTAAPPGRVAGFGWSTLQLLAVVGEGFVKDQLLLRASALTYFAMLSLIPLLAVAVGLLGAFGVSEDLARAVIDRVAAGSPEAGETILGLVKRVDFGSLGALGGATLLVTTVLGLSNVESAFNAIWGIERQRSPMRRFADYLAVLIIAPLLTTVAVSLGTSLRSDAVVSQLLANPLLADLYRTGLRQAPVFLLWLAFAFLYWFLPNASVRVGAALLGGAVGAVLFSIAQSVYIGFNVGVARSNAVFGSFAALPLLLVWLYFSWIVVLLGCEVAFAAHSLSRLRLARAGVEPGPAQREAIGLAVATRVARGFQTGEVVGSEEIAVELDVAVRTIRSLLADLEAGGIVALRGGDEQARYQLARAAAAITVDDVLGALRGRAELPIAAGREYDPVRGVVGEIETSVAEVVQVRTLADLVGVARPATGDAPARREG